MNPIGAERKNTHAVRTISDGEVHVWEIALDHPAINNVYLFNEVLSEDERVRASRLGLSVYRDKFVTARGYLRIILGCYLNTRPADIEFEYNEHGKPAIAAESDRKKISFNLSHSRNLALCAVAAKCDVGIDVEYIRPVLKPEKILERFFTPGEMEYFQSRPEIMRIRAFMSLWTIKEAYSKAVGRGFSSALKELDLSPVLSSTSPSAASISLEESDESWTILQIDTWNDYIAALAFKGDKPRISRFIADRSL
ncbi:MAG: 4'-phosphopantetheinyl transferase superfamily protein [Thermodesulfobacteriota bacterium]